ncbi:MAG TPA: cupin domain-containing protein [Gaiellaceae bacterium]|nr:cupin domain-containing protein [Gaiellaceae bacterium]
MVLEAEIETLPEGLGAAGPGWFVLNARDVRWWQREGLGRWADLEGDGDFEQLGIRVAVLQPGEPSGMYHRESGQEDFLVVAGECLAIVEGEERHLRAWDFVHCPPMTEHTFVGAGEGPCVMVTVGARKPDDEIVYPVNEVAARHGASVEVETPEPREAYAPYPREPLFQRYRDGDLPEL